MASTASSGRAKCKHNAAGIVCKCQEWDPSSTDESFCDCCAHHMSFHEPCNPIKSGFGRCVNDNVGSSHEDGCQEFFPSGLHPSKCDGCKCHRSWHEKVAVGELGSLSNIDSQQRDNFCVRCCATLIEPGRKKPKLDPATISIRVGEEQEAFGSDNVLKLESGGPGVHGTTIAEGDLQNESNVSAEDGNNIVRDNPLQPKHKVFVSHSGVQEDFVEQLCIDLERSDRYPFFNKRWSRFPVGVPMPRLLFDALQQCEVGVVVLSEEFFTKTKWPMVELVEMVRVQNKLIIPVYFSISREECCEPKTQERWILQWEKWAKEEPSINVDKWKEALKIFDDTTALHFKDGEVQFRETIVNAVCELVGPETKWDISYVVGQDRLCNIILEKVKLEPNALRVGVRVVGLHGVGGIGKTTICKVLCNKLSKECRSFKKVCLTELKSASAVELFRAVLKALTDTRLEVFSGMDDLDKCLVQLRRRIVKRPVFWAIDNVDEESAEQAKNYLAATAWFGDGSVVIVTSRSLDQLKALHIHEDDCLGMSELEEPEARALLKNRPTSNCDPRVDWDEQLITRCVEMCRFGKGDGTSHHYHPLALKTLGNELSKEWGRNGCDSKQWHAQLTMIESHHILETKKRIFSILRMSYKRLSPAEQMLLIDVAIYAQPNRFNSIFKLFDGSYGLNLFEWLGMVHGRTSGAVKKRLEVLKEKSLIEEVGDGSTNVCMHDLWREFCVAEIKEGRFSERRCVYVEEEFDEVGESTPSGQCWEHLERMCFTTEAGVQKFSDLCLEHFVNVKVLRVLHPMDWSNRVVVDLGRLKHLKHLEFSDYHNDFPIFFNEYWRGKTNPLDVKSIEVRGLGLLPKLAYLFWIGLPDMAYAKDIGHLTNLQFLKLPYCRGDELPDLGNLTSLRVVDFFACMEVKTITGLSSMLSNLRTLNLANCYELRSCPGLGELLNLQSLKLSDCRRLEELPDLGKLTRLRELVMRRCSNMICPSLFGLRRLWRMNVSGCSMFSDLPGLGDLVSLAELQAEGCEGLAELPDMSNLAELQILNTLESPLKAVPGLEGLVSLRELRASFELLEDWPDLRNLTSLLFLEIHGLSRQGLTMIMQHATLEAFLPYYGKEEVVLLNLKSMMELKILEFGAYIDEMAELCTKNLCVTDGCELQNLDIVQCNKLEVVDLNNLPRLETLRICNCKEALEKLTIKRSLGALRTLEILGCQYLEEVPNLGNFLCLKELYLEGCASLTSLTCTEPLPGLQKLYLGGCRSLEALPDLSNFPHLENLCLRKCYTLSSLTNSTALCALEELDLGGCQSLEALPDHLCRSEKLRVLHLGGSGIVLSDDDVNQLRASCEGLDVNKLLLALCKDVDVNKLPVSSEGLEEAEVGEGLEDAQVEEDSEDVADDLDLGRGECSLCDDLKAKLGKYRSSFDFKRFVDQIA